MGKQWKQWETLFFWNFKINANVDCHEIKRHLLLGRKAMTNLDSIFKSINSSALSFLYSPPLTSIHDNGKNHNFGYTDLCCVVVMSLLFNLLSRLVLAYLPRSKSLLISWLQSPSAVIWEPQKKVSHCFHCFPIYLPWSDGTRCHDLRFLNVEF